MGERVAFVGLGVMGYPMAGWLRRTGHEVTVFNRTAAKARVWAEEHGGSVAATPAEASANADLVFPCVGDDPDVRAVVLGPGGVLSAMRPGSVFVDHTTASADLARQIAAAGGERGVACKPHHGQSHHPQSR
jgi:3-hydroxyisobutyrate dehydrogenase-like beta-hydroxyacid dehydrogenase